MASLETYECNEILFNVNLFPSFRLFTYFRKGERFYDLESHIHELYPKGVNLNEM